MNGLFSARRWSVTLADSAALWQGFFFTLQVSLAGLAVALVIGTIMGTFSTTRSRVLRGAGVLHVHGRPAGDQGHHGRADHHEDCPVRPWRRGRGPLSRRLRGRGHPYRHRGHSSRADGGGAVAGLLARAGLPLHHLAADAPHHPAAPRQPGAQPREEHLGPRPYRRRRSPRRATCRATSCAA